MFICNIVWIIIILWRGYYECFFSQWVWGNMIHQPVIYLSLDYYAPLWSCLEWHWFFSFFYDRANEWPGYECVVPLCLSELCADVHIPESNSHPITKYASDLSMAFVLPKWWYYPARHVLMNLHFANMSGTKFNICLHFVFLQSQWSHFCFWLQPQQHPIPLALATVHKVRTTTWAMHVRLNNTKACRMAAEFLMQSQPFPEIW